MVYVPNSLQTAVWVLFNHKNSERAADLLPCEQRPFDLIDLSRKIEGPLLAGYRLANPQETKILRFWTYSWEKKCEVGKSCDMSQISQWKDFQLELLAWEVTYHFKATILDQMHLLGIFFRLSLLQYRSKVSWHSKLKIRDLILVGKQSLLMLLELFGKRTFPDRMRHLLSTWESLC